MKVQPPFRAGLIGCGNIGSMYDEQGAEDNVYTHAKALTRSDDFSLVAVADSDPERLETCKACWQVPHGYVDARQMMQEQNLDLVCIATPDTAHADLVELCLEMCPPRLIVCEKPIAGDVSRSERIVQKCREHNVMLSGHYLRRHDETHVALKEFLQTGKLGRITRVQGLYVRGLLHNGCNMLNLVSDYFGKIVSVQAFGREAGSLSHDPSLDVHMMTDSGVEVVMLGMDKPDYAFSLFEMDVFGSDGRLRLLDGGRHFELYQTVADPNFPNFAGLDSVQPDWLHSSLHIAMVHAAENWAALLKGELADDPCDAEHALMDLRVVDAARRSANGSGAVVKLDI